MKNLLLSAFALFAFSNLSAQDTRLGVKAGGNIAWLNGDGELSKPVPGFHAGLFAEIKITEKFAFQPEVFYSHQGGKDEKNEHDGWLQINEKMRVTLGYINIPVLAKYYVSKKFSIEGGPQLGINVLARQKFEFDDNSSGIRIIAGYNMSVKESVKALDFGLAFGTGYDLNDHLFLQARYVIGMTTVHKEINDEFGNFSPDIKNGVGQISVGYRF